MNLKILLPAEVLLSEKVAKVVAEAANGFFCLLPHHVDYTAALVPGIFLYETEDEEKKEEADHGKLVPDEEAKFEMERFRIDDWSISHYSN